MNIIAVVIRRLHLWFDNFNSGRRILMLKLLYPNIEIDSKTYIGKNCIIKCASNSRLEIIKSKINNGCVIVADHGGQLIVRNSFIGGSTWIVARKFISIESSLIAEMVSIRDNNHKYDEAFEKPIAEQGFTLGQVEVKENVWLGSKVTVLLNTTINSGTVVGANSVVKGILEENSVYVGAPAKKIR